MAEAAFEPTPAAVAGAKAAFANALPPRLENGDRLTRCEFERRYAAQKNLKKAELIEGVVYLPSPVRAASHAEPHFLLIFWLATYAQATPGVKGADNATIRLDLDNEPQPDALLRIECGQAALSDDDYIEGAPELVVEVAAGSASIDMHDKLRAYRRNGVREYLVWRTGDKRIDWLALVDDDYRSLPVDRRGVIHSKVFPGLRLAVGAMAKGDLKGVIGEQRKGLRTRRHREFVERLGGNLALGNNAAGNP